MKLRHLSLAAAFMLAAVAGCSKPQPPPDAPAPPPKPPRAETKDITAASAVGYNGDKIRGKVDGVLDQNDERNKKLQDLAQ